MLWRSVWEEVAEQEVPRVSLLTPEPLSDPGYTRTWPRHPCFIQDLHERVIPFLPQQLLPAPRVGMGSSRGSA